MKAFKAVIFWLLIALAGVGAWWATKHDPRESLRTAAFVVPFVVLTQWFASCFSGRKRRTAWIAIYWALGAMVAGAYAFWDITLLRVGYPEPQSLAKALVAGAIFVVCSSASVWSLLSLRKSAATN